MPPTAAPAPGWSHPRLHTEGPDFSASSGLRDTGPDSARSLLSGLEALPPPPAPSPGPRPASFLNSRQWSLKIRTRCCSRTRRTLGAPLWAPPNLRTPHPATPSLCLPSEAPPSPTLLAPRAPHGPTLLAPISTLLTQILTLSYTLTLPLSQVPPASFIRITPLSPSHPLPLPPLGCAPPRLTPIPPLPLSPRTPLSPTLSVSLPPPQETALTPLSLPHPPAYLLVVSTQIGRRGPRISTGTPGPLGWWGNAWQARRTLRSSGTQEPWPRPWWPIWGTAALLATCSYCFCSVCGWADLARPPL